MEMTVIEEDIAKCRFRIARRTLPAPAGLQVWCCWNGVYVDTAEELVEGPYPVLLFAAVDASLTGPADYRSVQKAGYREVTLEMPDEMCAAAHGELGALCPGHEPWVYTPAQGPDG